MRLLPRRGAADFHSNEAFSQSIGPPPVTAMVAPDT
ncbi:MAG: hypothetical protein K0R27_3774 [Xanthobacteraceae bacterium]|jgi:hypothetical protein|nr:hypothetical protein [Xanthobacteraceae bacterium]